MDTVGFGHFESSLTSQQSRFLPGFLKKNRYTGTWNFFTCSQNIVRTTLCYHNAKTLKLAVINILINDNNYIPQ